jgi:hypothetical protein
MGARRRSVREQIARGVGQLIIQCQLRALGGYEDSRRKYPLECRAHREALIRPAGELPAVARIECEDADPTANTGFDRG